MDNKLNQYDLVIVKYYSDLDNAARFEADFKCLETITKSYWFNLLSILILI